MKKTLLTFLFLITSTCVIAQSDSMKKASDGIIDICHAPEFTYKQRIEWGANRFEALIDLSIQHADEGDTELLVRAYEAFASLFSTQDDMEKLDQWNRRFLNKMDLKRPLHFNTYLFMCAAYLQTSDLNYKKAAESFSLKGEAKWGLKFLSDFPLALESLDSYDHARLLAMKSTLCLFGGEFDEAAKGFAEASKLVEKDFGKNSAEYLYFRMFEELPAAYKKDFTSAYSIATEIEIALKDFHQNLTALGKTLNGVDFQEYSWLLSRKGSYCHQLGKISEEEIYNKAALEASYNNNVGDMGSARMGVSNRMISPYKSLCLPFHGPEHFLQRDIFSIKESVAENEYKAGRKKEALEMFKELMGDYRTAANDTKGYSKVDISTVKQKMEPLIEIAPLCVYRFPDDAEIQSSAYDCALLYKNFCLLTDNLVQYLVKKDRDPGVRQLYDKLMTAIDQLDKVKKDDAPSKREEIAQLREQLLVELDFSSYGSILNTSWKAVQQKLSPKSVAIEFMLCQDDDGKKKILALVLHHEGIPCCVELCEEKDLSALSDVYSTPNAYNMIWKPLQGELTNVKTVYFSPTGLLHKIAIEYLPDATGKIIGQNYEMYRLSSTRELFENHESSDSKQCVVYGGILYDLPTDGAGFSNTDLAPEVLDNQQLRSGISYLPQTLVEMQNVSEIFEPSFEVTTYSAEKATEESFKLLSGKNLDVLHIATHGFYVPKFRKSAITKLTKNPFNSLEDQSLSLSGIMMAGANNTLSKKHMTGEDGILTAKEISRMDMDNVGLVVLSACETGLGEITDEGVFGLQRGFKKAGVKTIVMSLWEVDDEATQVLMSAFYKNYITGMSKRKAFMEAQNYLRTTEEKKFDDPRFWAAFIMLDAIE